jgi:hypothetical protein
MKSLKILPLLFLCTALFASDYKIKKVELHPVESYPARCTVDRITIAADPYPDNKKSATAFDVSNMNSSGFFPVHIIVRNDSPYYLKIQTRNIVMETRLGQQLFSTPAAMVVEEVIGDKFSSSLSRMGGATEEGVLASPLSDFTGKELTNRLIDPGTTYDGFLFFFSEKNKRSFFIGSTLRIPNLEEEGTHKAFGPFTIQLDPALTDLK